MERILFFKIRSSFLTIACLTLILAAYPGSGLCETKETAVVAAVAPDYSSAAHSLISVEPVNGVRTVQNNLLPTDTSDISLSAYKNFFYRLERYQADNIIKFDINAPDVPVWQFSAMDENETGSSNPYGLFFVNSQKAYLLRYGTAKAWIVNPGASTQAEFKIGELDLSAYADSDGIPEMNYGVIIGNKFFILLQRLDRDNNFFPSNTPYIAVFDVNTDKEIETGLENQDNLKGIALNIKNPGSINYLDDNNTIYVHGVGDYGSSWSGREPEYSGGIISIDPVTYEVKTVLDDGDADNHPYGNISGMSIVSPEKAYFVGYAGWGDNSLYAFNPSTGQVSGIANNELKNKNIAGMASGTYADKNNMLWVCNQTDGLVVILDTDDNSINEKISTNLNPVSIVFTSEEIMEEPEKEEDKTDEPDTDTQTDDDHGSSSSCFITSTGTNLFFTPAKAKFIK
ncbi:WD40-like repeat-containing [Desulfonema limicola]|uniref:WD40-like repeat-containing n=1 Tax=Desulfonema limicola TaxID=45656 RepID=A0A975BCA5_9BACT|nr:hypothetical protein [Desulfonema limicola]QTA82614.1 WD40-like repeat-containing [Desulfonema limicola]